jgi:hypothetical protein
MKWDQHLCDTFHATMDEQLLSAAARGPRRPFGASG